jgi:hypothetical protein
MRKEPSVFSSIFGANTTKPSTVDGVMEAFNTTIADLETVSQINEAAAQEAERVIAAQSEVKARALSESLRATGIAQKMKAIFE